MEQHSKGFKIKYKSINLLNWKTESASYNQLFLNFFQTMSIQCIRVMQDKVIKPKVLILGITNRFLSNIELRAVFFKCSTNQGLL